MLVAELEPVGSTHFYPHRVMTTQVNDTCFHRKFDFWIVGFSGTGLIDRAAFGIEPVSWSTACRHGYVAHYLILDGQLFLTSLDIGLSHTDAVHARAGKGPELFGVLPNTCGFHRFLYEGFQSSVPFTGGLLLADDLIRELHFNMGFHPAWKYKNVREVIFDAGRVTDDFDRTADMAAAQTDIINEMRSSEGLMNEGTRGAIEARILNSFSRKY